MTKSKADIIRGGVDEYIANCPKDIQDKLRDIRLAIRAVAPGSFETVSYFQIPGYGYDDYDFYNGMFVWFSYKKPYVRLHLSPTVIEDHIKELKDYPTTKSIVNFPIDKDLPIELVKELVRASLSVMKNASS